MKRLYRLTERPRHPIFAPKMWANLPFWRSAQTGLASHAANIQDFSSVAAQCKIWQLPMRYLLDVNALVALGLLQHEFHQQVARWVKSLGSAGVAELSACSITEFGFVPVLAQAEQ